LTASHHERGRALEDLLVPLFELVPGVSATVRNRMNAFDAEEIDVAFRNEGLPAGLRMFDHILLVECKTWSTPAGYPELAVFNDKVTSRGRPMGIFVAGSASREKPRSSRRRTPSLTAPSPTVGRSSSHPTGIERLCDTDELVHLLKRKRAPLAVSGTNFEQ